MKAVIIRKLGLAIFSTVGALFLAEGLARLVLPAPPQVIVATDRETLDLAAEQPATRARLKTSPDEGFIYIGTPTGIRLRPNAHVVIENHAVSGRQIEIRTNRQGYRNPELGTKTGPRLLFLGDSITFADYLDEDETFVRRVEQRARADRHDWETVNAGVGGISLQNELAILVETGLATRPDAVIVCFYLNDFMASPGVYLQPVPVPLSMSRLASFLWVTLPRLQADRSTPTTPCRADRTARLDIKHLRQEFEALQASSSAIQSTEERRFYDAVTRHFSDWGGAWSPGVWPNMVTCFREFRQLADRHGFDLFIVAFPVRDQVHAKVMHNTPQARLAKLAADLDIPFLDLLPHLRAAHAEADGPLFYDACHHTPEGSRIVASVIYDFLLPHLETRAE